MPALSGAVAAAVILVALASALGAPAPAAAQGTITVTSTEDTDDVLWGDGRCGDTLGRCTLRGAIQEANAREGADVIRFRIASGPQTIKPASAYPVLFEAVTVDATTQPGYAGRPLIEIDGSDAGEGSDGLVLAAEASVAKGLAITHFDGIGVVMADGEGSRLESSYVGLAPDGITPAGNGGHGVHLAGCRGCVVGGDDPALRNVISGNGGNGVYLTEVGTRGNRIAGNFIGTDALGEVAVANRVDGVAIENAPDNTIGGGEVGASNLISGNGDDGVDILGPGAVSVTVEANWIGTTRTGDGPLGNGDAGVVVVETAEHRVVRNVVAASGGNGIEVGGGARRVSVAGNFVGTNPVAGSGLGNGGAGVAVLDGAGNVVGGRGEGASNTIAANAGAGVLVAGARAVGNIVVSNRLGSQAVPPAEPRREPPAGAPANGGGAIVVARGARGTTVAANLLVGSRRHGLRIVGAGTDATVVAGNIISGSLGAGVFVGTGAGPTRIVADDAGGAAAPRAAAPGVGGSGAAGSGAAVSLAAGNVVLGNLGGGIILAGDGSVVQGAWIGLDPDSGLPVPNGSVGSPRPGIAVSGSGNAIGGGEANVVAHNTGAGVAVLGGSGNTIIGNRIFRNGGLGIDLGNDGPTPNDDADADSGPNDLINFPIIEAARGRPSLGGDAFVLVASASYAGAPGTTIAVDAYGVGACEAGDQRPPVVWLGRAGAVTDFQGAAQLVVGPLPLPDEAMALILTATDGHGSTSEFSPCTSVLRYYSYVPAVAVTR